MLSELMRTFNNLEDEEKYLQFVHEFGKSTVGIKYLLREDSENTFKCRSDGIFLEVALDAYGRKMFRVYADPQLYKDRNDIVFSDTMTGKAACEILFQITAADGIFVCSAIDAVDFPIFREEAAKILNASQVPAPKAWWKVW